MPALPIPIEDYPAIREAIDVSLTADDLSDETIGRSTFAGAAEDWVASQDPAWATRTGRMERAVARAAIYRCAAMLVNRVAMMTSERMGNYAYTRVASDPTALAVELQGLADAEISVAVGSQADSDLDGSAFFTRAPGHRGR